MIDTNSEPQTIWIDCDPGLDDAAAILMALGLKRNFRVLGLSSVAGNVGLEETTRNACGVLALAGRSDIPVYAGCPRAMMSGDMRAPRIHGADGIGGVRLPEGEPPVAGTHAVSALIEASRTAGKAGLTLVITGPMTNVACAIVAAPDIVSCWRRVVFMGGVAFEAGNVTDYAEFNILADPHAASLTLDAVQDSGVELVMAGLDVTRKVPLTDARIRAMRDIGNPASQALADMMTAYRSNVDKAVLHDACTIAWLAAPDYFGGTIGRLMIDYTMGIRMGAVTVTERATPEGGALILSEVDDTRFYMLLTDALKAL